MKVALFHNSYQIRGGEDSMFQLEADALRAHGHEVLTYLVDNSSTLADQGLKAKIRTAFNAPHNKSSEQAIAQFLKAEQPDISHVHNWFPLLSPSIYHAHQAMSVPVVQTLHNYRLGCAAATYRRKGKDCTLCSTGNNCAAIKNRCYKNSLAGSLTWKRVMDRNWSNGTFTELVDHYLCPSKEVYNRHRALGIPESRISILPNACPDPQAASSSKRIERKRQVCFIGRLVPEKGAHTLIDAWHSLSAPTLTKSQLNIIGHGPETNALKQLAQGDPNILFHGELSHSDTLQMLCLSDLLVCPSLWAEPFGLSIIEAMGAAIPVIASDLGGPAELVEDGLTGYLVSPGDASALALKIDHLLTYPSEALHMGLEGRTRYEALYTPAAHATLLTECFERVRQQRMAHA